AGCSFNGHWERSPSQRGCGTARRTVRRGMGPGSRSALRRARRLAGHQPRELVLEPPHAVAQLFVLRFQPPGLAGAGEGRVELPPVQPDLLRLVDGADEEADLD